MTNYTITPTELPAKINPNPKPQSRWSGVYKAMNETPNQWLAIEGCTAKEAESLKNIIRGHSSPTNKGRVQTLEGFYTEAVIDRPHGKPVVVYVRATRLQDNPVKLAM